VRKILFGPRLAAPMGEVNSRAGARPLQADD